MSAVSSTETFRRWKIGPIRRQWWDTQPSMRDGMIEEIWKLGPFELVWHYVKSDRSYGDWTFSGLFALRRWCGPYFTFGFGTGAQDWDEED